MPADATLTVKGQHYTRDSQGIWWAVGGHVPVPVATPHGDTLDALWATEERLRQLGEWLNYSREIYGDDTEPHERLFNFQDGSVVADLIDGKWPLAATVEVPRG